MNKLSRPHPVSPLLGISFMLAGLLLMRSGTADAPVANTSQPATPHGEVYTDWPFDAQEAARRQEATAKALGVPKEVTLDLGDQGQIKFALIPAGRFMMGTADAETVPHWKDETLHEVVIGKPFYMGLHHVTQAQWR